MIFYYQNITIFGASSKVFSIVGKTDMENLMSVSFQYFSFKERCLLP